MSHSHLANLEEQKLNSLHWKMVFTAGMGFFTDSYDLFIIGVVTTLLMPIWHLSIEQLSLLNGAALASAACGAILFGFFADKFGRKKMYGIEVLILFIGAVISALSPNFYVLLFARILVGLGIGGDYPTSAVVTSEHANRQNRGFLVLMVFAMQSLGLLVGPLLASLFLALNIAPDITWRILLGIGAIPAASVFYLRRQISETPHFMLSKEKLFEGGHAVNVMTGSEEDVPKKTFAKQSIFDKKFLKYVVGTAGSWFLLDVVFYGNGISLTYIFHSINAHGDLLRHTLLSAFIFLLFAVPGYFFAAKYIDKIGRKFLQVLGFIMIAICYVILAFPFIQSNLILFVLFFGLSFFFVNFGPNTTTFLIPSEIYPTNIRARAHGISAATGKLGAFIGAASLPLFMHSYGLSLTMYALGIISFIGIAATQLLPEMKGKSLESVEEVQFQEM